MQQYQFYYKEKITLRDIYRDYECGRDRYQNNHPYVGVGSYNKTLYNKIKRAVDLAKISRRVIFSL
jgi:hypothetical protein